MKLTFYVLLAVTASYVYYGYEKGREAMESPKVTSLVRMSAVSPTRPVERDGVRDEASSVFLSGGNGKDAIDYETISEQELQRVLTNKFKSLPDQRDQVKAAFSEAERMRDDITADFAAWF